MDLLAAIRNSLAFGNSLYLAFVPLAAACLGMGVIAYGLILRRRPRRTYGSSYPRVGRIKLWLAAAVVLAASAVAAAQPRITAGASIFKRDRVDVLIAVDVSASMWVKDLGPSRLEVAVREIVNLQSEGILQAGDRAGLFAFGGTTIRKAHLSTNVPRLMEVVAQLSPPATLTGDSFPWSSDLVNALEHIYQSVDMQDRFEAGAGQNDWVPAQRPDRVVFLLTDGDFAADRNQIRRLDTALAEFRQRGLSVYPVGIGSRSPSDLTTILRAYDRGRDYDATLVAELQGQRTRLEMRDLTVLARQTGGRTFVIDSLGSSATSFFRDAVAAHRPISFQLIPNPETEEAWQYFVAAAVLVFALAIFFY